MIQTQHPLAGLLKDCPEFFYVRTIDNHSYYVPNYITWEVKRAMERADQQAYCAAKPEESKPDIDFAKFSAWIASEESEAAINAAEARVLFVPKADAPPVNARKLPLAIWREAQNFFERPLPVNSSALTDAIVNSEENISNADTPQV
ncbi:MAG TPA: hypothetical protein VGM92_04850 [Candidatus Kapabacteria bacterium]|jgi:hypothetical protein